VKRSDADERDFLVAIALTSRFDPVGVHEKYPGMAALG
jgi:hypothetical protein